MAGLPWFELDTDFAESPKVRALAARLREPLADAYVARLYAYCYRHARDRFDAEVASELIEEACRWKGRRGTLFDALHAVDVLEREAGKVVVHGVKERLGPHLSKRAGDAERQKRRRDKVAESALRHAGVTRDVTRESRGNKDRDKDRDTEAAQAPAETIPTLGQHLAERYPSLHALVEALDASGLGRALPRNATTRGALDQIAKRHGVEALVADVAARPEGQSLAWYATRWAAPDFRPPSVAAEVMRPEPVPAGCAEWERLRGSLGERLRPDLFDRWFARVTGEVVDGALVLRTPDEFHRRFLADEYADLLAKESKAMFGNLRLAVE